MDDRSPVVFISGQTQNGKSTLKRALVKCRRRVLEIAPFPVRRDDYAVDQFASIDEAAHAYMSNKVKSFRMAAVVTSPEDFKKACWFVWMLASEDDEPTTLVLDETRLFIPSAAEAPLEFNYISQAWAHAGDHLGLKRVVHLICVGQSMTNLPPVFRSETCVHYAFRMNALADRRRLRDDFGVPEEISEKTGNLKPYHYMRFDRFGDVSYGQTKK